MPGGRPRLRHKRSAIVTARLHPIELNILKRRAAALGISIADYLRMAALGCMPYIRIRPSRNELNQASENDLRPGLIPWDAESDFDGLMRARFRRQMTLNSSPWNEYLRDLKSYTER